MVEVKWLQAEKLWRRLRPPAFQLGNDQKIAMGKTTETMIIMVVRLVKWIETQ